MYIIYTRLYTRLNIMTEYECFKFMTKETASKSYNVENYV